MKQLFLFLTVLSCVFAACTLPQRFPSTSTAENGKSDPGRYNFIGGDGSSKENAIIISGARNDHDATNAEYYYMASKFGERNVDWKLTMQSSEGGNGKMYDHLELDDIKNNNKIDLYFDITKTYGKF